VYDAFGRRLEKVINSRRSQFQYDAVNIHTEFREGNQINYLRGLSVDETFSATDGTGTRYATIDALGSIINLTDQNAAQQAAYQYGPFGQTQRTGQDGENPFQFTGRESDETGLQYYRFRYYHPVLSRFISEDPLGTSSNRYAYVSNSPLNAVDPFGLYEEDVHLHLTYFLARKAGFATWAAATIAAGDQGQDDNPQLSAMGLFNFQQRRDYHFTSEEQRTKLWQASLNGDLIALGQYFHALQDSYSHEGFGWFWGHLFRGHKPDKTYNDPEKANEMARDTYYRVRQWLQQFCAEEIPDNWDQIRDQVDRFNRTRGLKEKLKILAR
jgi:RHS repeat-associated protein